MKKINLKRSVSLIYLTLIAALLLSILPANVKAIRTVLAIIPEDNIFNVDATPVDSAFDVNVTLRDVKYLWSWQTRVLFDPNILTCVNASIPSDSPFIFQFQIGPLIDNVIGYVQLGASQMGATPGVSGRGVLATLAFKIIDAPTTPDKPLSCGISFSRPYDEDTFLLDPTARTIEPVNFEDGYYEYNVHPVLAVTPQEFSTAEKGVGDSFIVNASLKIHNLWRWQIKVTFNSTLLNCANISIPSDSPFNFSTHITPEIDNTIGYILIGANQTGTEPSVNATGTLACINFTIMMEPDPDSFLYCDVAFDETQTYLLYANFSPITATMENGYFLYGTPYTLTISASTGGATDPAVRDHIYPVGTNVTVTAIPDVGYDFANWMLDGVNYTDNPITVTVDANHTLHAVFVVIPPPEIVEVKQDPLADNVLAGQAVKVSVNVTGYGTGVKKVRLSYTVDNWTTTEGSWMGFNGTSGFWEVEIPGQDSVMLIKYKVEAYDYAGNYVVDNNAGFYYVYTVIPEFAIIAFLIALLLATLSAAILTKHSKKLQD
jgi:hypothetical protein